MINGDKVKNLIVKATSLKVFQLWECTNSRGFAAPSIVKG